jgi:hypothetical protein
MRCDSSQHLGRVHLCFLSYLYSQEGNFVLQMTPLSGVSYMYMQCLFHKNRNLIGDTFEQT